MQLPIKSFRLDNKGGPVVTLQLQLPLSFDGAIITSISRRDISQKLNLYSPHGRPNFGGN